MRETHSSLNESVESSLKAFDMSLSFLQLECNNFIDKSVQATIQVLYESKLNMDLNAYKPKNINEDLLLLITKTTGTLIQQTQTKAQETLEFKFRKLRESFTFDIPLQLENGEWMLGLTSLELYNSIFNITNENSKLELFRPIKKERPYSLEDLKIADGNFRPHDLNDELFRPVVIDKLREFEFHYNNIMRKTLHLTEEEIESIGIRNKTEDSVFDEILLEQSNFQGLESFLGTMRTEEDEINFILQKYSSNFETYEITPGIYEVSDPNNSVDK